MAVLALLPLNILGTYDFSGRGNIVSLYGNLKYQDTQPSFSDTDGSYFFDGASSWISMSGGTDFAFGTADFTIECMIKNVIESSAYGRIIIDTRPDATNGNYWILSTSIDGRGIYFSDGTNSHDVPSCLSSTDFNHIAVTRAAGTLRLFVDGVVKQEVNNNTASIGASVFRIGANAHKVDGTYAKANITQLRVVKDEAKYTANFTPPSQSFVLLSDISQRSIQAQFPRKDQVDGGAYRLTGVVTSNGIPASRRVRLFDQISGRMMRETWSDAVTGVYIFENIRQGTFFVLAHDHTGAFDPEAKADLVAEAI